MNGQNGLIWTKDKRLLDKGLKDKIPLLFELK